MDTDSLIRNALAEDLPDGHDRTSEWFVPTALDIAAWIEAREHAVVSGLEVAARVFKTVDETVEVRATVQDGDVVGPLQHVIELRGRARAVLCAERTALNFLCHLSGVATLTRRFVEAVGDGPTRILGTRKTTPGLRELEIAAVRHGGGDVYRDSLSGAVLLKDNHESLLGGIAGVRERLARIEQEDSDVFRAIRRDGKIEVSSLEELEAAVEMGWPQVLLDNFAPAEVAEAVRQWGSRVFLEASGGVNLSNVRDYAATGVHAVSLGAITHSAKAADFSLEVERRRT